MNLLGSSGKLIFGTFLFLVLALSFVSAQEYKIPVMFNGVVDQGENTFDSETFVSASDDVMYILNGYIEPNSLVWKIDFEAAKKAGVNATGEFVSISVLDVADYWIHTKDTSFTYPAGTDVFVNTTWANFDGNFETSGFWLTKYEDGVPDSQIWYYVKGNVDIVNSWITSIEEEEEPIVSPPSMFNGVSLVGWNVFEDGKSIVAPKNWSYISSGSLKADNVWSADFKAGVPWTSGELEISDLKDYWIHTPETEFIYPKGSSVFVNGTWAYFLGDFQTEGFWLTKFKGSSNNSQIWYYVKGSVNIDNMWITSVNGSGGDSPDAPDFGDDDKDDDSGSSKKTHKDDPVVRDRDNLAPDRGENFDKNIGSSYNVINLNDEEYYDVVLNSEVGDKNVNYVGLLLTLLFADLILLFVVLVYFLLYR